MKCNSCGSDLRLLEYQSRSADEAHTSVYKCPLCPFDIEKFFRQPLTPHTYLASSSQSVKRTPVIDSSHHRASTVLYLKSKNMSLVSHLPRYTSKACNYIDQSSRLFKSYVSGCWKGLALHKSEKKYISVNAYVQNTLWIDDSPSTQLTYLDFEYSILDNYIVIFEQSSIYLVRECDNESSILEHLEDLYSIGFSPSTLQKYINKVTLGSMSNMSARAYDAATATDFKHSFSTKPDGERMWLVKSASVWFYCRRLLGFQVVHWHIESNICYLTEVSISVVLDVETMISFQPILIDILMDENSVLTPYTRNTAWINTKILHLKSIFEYLKNIHVRDFFDTFEEAHKYSLSVQYPIDGLVAIDSLGVDMKKLKPIKSIELTVKEDSTLATKENKSLFRLSGNNSYETGSIVEVRFVIEDVGLRVREVFQRYDKAIANGNEAVECIISSCIAPNSSNMVRTLLWRWSNQLRTQVYRMATGVDKEKNIILDIGTGSGQSTETLSQLDGYSFILVEPDSTKCTSLSKRLSIKTIHTSPRSIIPAILQLKQGMKKYHILNTDLKSLLSDQVVVINLKNILKCSVACFSAQFIYNEIDTLTSCGIPFVGCYYSYSGVKPGESIVDSSGISMKRVSESESYVKWGTDKAYREPAVDVAEHCITVTSISAIDMVDSPIQDKSSNVYRACAAVKVLISI